MQSCNMLFQRGLCSGLERTVLNRNPRSLERLSIARKPDGWHLEKEGKSFWHKLEVERSARHVTAKIVHFTGAIPVTCSTRDWALRKHLYRTNDTSAYVNLGRVLGVKCLEAGLNEVACFLQRIPGGKIDKLLNEVETTGVSLVESPVYKEPQPSDWDRPEKPWTLLD